MLAQVLPALAVTLAAQILTTMSVGTGPVLAPLAAVDIGVSPELIGAYIALVYCTAAIVGLICGSFIARFGALRVTQASLLLIASGLSIGALALPVAVLVSALTLGLGNGVTTPSSSHVLARVTPATWRNAVFSTKQMGVPLGNGLADLIMPGLALALGWRPATLIAAVACVALALLIEPWRPGLDIGLDPARRLFARGMITGPLRLVFRAPALRRLSIVSFVYSGLQTCFVAFLVTYLHDRLELSLVRAGLVLAISQAAGAAGRLIWGTLTDRLLDPQKLLGGLGFGMALCALATAAFTTGWPFWALVTVAIAFGATTSGWNGVFLAQVAVLSPDGKVGEATGGSQFCTFAGVTTMPALFSLALAVTGSYAVGFIALAVLAALSGAWLFVALRQRKT